MQAKEACYAREWGLRTRSYEEEDTCMSYEEEDTCMSKETHTSVKRDLHSVKWDLH